MPEEKKQFWETLPGILTGLAALITAIAGLIAIFIRTSDNPQKNREEPVPVTQAPSHRRTKEEGPTRLPAPREVAPRINVQGTWHDVNLGTVVRFSQSGNNVRTETFQLATGQRLATGSGVIKGRTITGQYRWFDGTPYSARLSVSEDGLMITGTYHNSLTGESGPVDLTR